MTSNSDHISICICTYKRPKLLKRLLGELQDQITNQLFTYSIVIVDNDKSQTAKSTVTSFKQKSSVPIDYYLETEQNIALARNKAVENATGNFIAFIDDDEFPENTWLINLYQAYRRFNADGILGPVKPHFDEKPPKWIIKGKICELPSHETGTVLKVNQTRTGNVLFDKRIFDDKNHRFNPDYGRGGGEDIVFFAQMIKAGRTFVWCDDAVVYETVPRERWTKSYYIKRFLRIGGLAGESKRRGPLRGYRYLIKFSIALTVYTLLLPFCFLFGPHVYVKYLMKFSYNFGWVFGFFGIVLIRLKTD